MEEERSSLTQTIDDVEPRQSDCCWTCSFSMFNRRTASLVSKGACLREFPEVHEGDLGAFWSPPKKFWDEIGEPGFPNTFEVFLEEKGESYWGDRYLVEQDVGADLHLDMDHIEKEFEKMLWLFRFQNNFARIQPMLVCGAYSDRG